MLLTTAEQTEKLPVHRWYVIPEAFSPAMSTSGEIGVLDANIIIYAHDTHSSLHQRALRFFENAINGRIRCALTPQVLLEFVAVITN